MTAIISCVQMQIYKLPYGHYRDMFLQIFYELQIYNIYTIQIYIQFNKKKKTNKLKAHYLATVSFMLLNNLQATQMLCNNNLRYKVYKVY